MALNFGDYGPLTSVYTTPLPAEPAEAKIFGKTIKFTLDDEDITQYITSMDIENNLYTPGGVEVTVHLPLNVIKSNGPYPDGTTQKKILMDIAKTMIEKETAE